MDEKEQEIKKLRAELLKRHDNGESWHALARELSNDELELSGALVRLFALGERPAKGLLISQGIVEEMVLVPKSMVRKNKPKANKPRQRLSVDASPRVQEIFNDLADDAGVDRSMFMLKLLGLWLETQARENFNIALGSDDKKFDRLTYEYQPREKSEEND